VRPKDVHLAGRLEHGLRQYQSEQQPLPGVRSKSHLTTLLEQLVESVHRIEYIHTLSNRRLSPRRTDPSTELFDPIKAAVLKDRAHDVEEAIWLIFLSVHFGKHRRAGWRLIRDVYGRLGQGLWDWPTTAADPIAFRNWLGKNVRTLAGGDGIPRHFGNHRKYQSLDAWSSTGTGAAVESYVRWVDPPRRQSEVFAEALEAANGNPRQAFAHMYKTMKVSSFARPGQFDFLTMVGKLGLAVLEPDRPYLSGATGPWAGARLLYTGSMSGTSSRSQLEAWLVTLEGYLRVGMQVIEDALCNWQKSPASFDPFRG
jgi:hypothetical protein